MALELAVELGPHAPGGTLAPKTRVTWECLQGAHPLSEEKANSVTFTSS